MNQRKDLIAHLATTCSKTKAQAAADLTATLNAIATLARDGGITLRGYGKFVVKHRRCGVDVLTFKAGAGQRSASVPQVPA